MKAFYRQTIPETNCARKETVDIDMPVTWNSDRKIIVYQNNKYTSLVNNEVEPTEPVQINIYSSNTYRKDLSWLHFDDERRVEERQ